MIQTFKRRFIFWLVLGSLFLASIATQIMLHQVRANARNDISIYGDSLPTALIGFESAIGYTGFIHNFKNFVLRSEETAYREAARADYEAANAYLDELETLATQIGIEIETGRIRDTLKTYVAALDEVEAQFAAGRSIADIDEIVRISDLPAALDISKIGRELRGAYQERIQTEVAVLTQILRVLFVMAVILPITMILFAIVWLRDERAQLRQLDQINTELSLKNRRLERQNKELADFTSFSAHDLRTPMRGIANNARFLMEDCGPSISDQARKRIDRIQDLCTTMETLVETLLRYGGIGPAEAKAALDPAQIIEDIKTRLPNGRADSVVVETALPKVAVDRAQFTSVMGHLITNALTFNDSSDPKVWIGYTEKPPGDITDPPGAFYVRDNGIGIDAELQTDVFGLFKRLHRPGDYGPGIGAGLAFVKKIVDLNGGRVAIDSQPGQGTTVYVSLDTYGVEKNAA